MRQHVRYALFIAAYAQFEQALLEICNDYRERKGIAVTPKDIAGQGLKKFQTYINKVVGVKFPDDLDEWNRILQLNKLRNYLVHENLWITNSQYNKEVHKIIQQERYLSVFVPSEVRFKKQFVPNVVDLFEAFIEELAYRSVDDLSSLGKSKNRRLSLLKVKRRIARGVL